ncbi:50S ribosomal protein L25/general stress protein Ctc [Methylomarinum sp. Ch1-1]|uniref:Large ribosomal subunit protein bL25 n=1 Tax=Methylomarinum roseum TaxID=3067653 RepID=A0AAU7NWD8_9GAMM|nr:50S ribosomal protein L25/general stress protein Ctc [Methylomarinum sp. Ch1-1]MDP4519036.1 50S ribosomal protein L25/general stress protein Ctc [Methylomarinum sp. Ch1-1]
MSNVFEFVAETRDMSGKNAAKAARREGKVPAVIYGGESAPEMLVLEHNEILKHLDHEAVYSHILDVKVDGKTQKALLKDIQRHPAKPQVLHMDFMRVDESHQVKMHVPLHFINEETCVGVKTGGVVTHAMVDVEVSCMPSALPEYLEVDLADVELGAVVHMSDIKLPAGVEIPELAHGEDHDHPIAQVVKTRGAGEEAEAAEEEGAAE